MESNQRLFLTIVLTMGVVFLWQTFIVEPEVQRQRAAQQAQQQAEEAKQAAAKGPTDNKKAASPEAKSGEPTQIAAAKPETTTSDQSAMQGPEALHVVDLEGAKVTLTSKGARIKSWVLSGYRESVDKDAAGVEMISGEPLPTLDFEGLGGYDPRGNWTLQAGDDPFKVVFTASVGGYDLKRSYTFRADGLDFDHRLEVRSSRGGTLRPIIYTDYRLSEKKLSEKPGMMNPAVDVPQPICFVQGDREIEHPDELEVGEPKDFKGKLSWLGVDQRYFLAALVPLEIPTAHCTMARPEKLSFRTEMHLPELDVEAGGNAAMAWLGYIGPKEVEGLKALGHELDRSVDLSLFGVHWGFLADPMLWFLKLTFGFFGNYGLAIILLTILVRGLLFPLTAKMMVNMERMKQLKPEMDAIKEKYAEDRERLNREIAALFRRHQVNPLGGCLPAFLQMPIGLALYRMLYSAVELYQAPFIPGWINDLSAKDPYYVMPLLLGVIMYVQQRMNPQMQDGPQAKMLMYIMPVMFTFIMLALPSGLVLYILISTLLGIVQQKYMGRRLQAAKPAAPTPLATGGAGRAR